MQKTNVQKATPELSFLSSVLALFWFHHQVIGTKSANLDTFFASASCVRSLLGMNADGCDVAVIEGVMGYYDGVGGISTQASAYDVADVTDTPVVLIVNTKGMSLSVFAYIKGFLEYQENSHIAGVIFNQMSPMLYPRMKKLAEEQGIRVLGYVPVVKDCVIESRHLGLVLPEEIPELKEKLQALAKILEDTLEIDEILKLAESAVELDINEALEKENPAFSYRTEKKVRIGVADDEAFCFFYKDNFRLLRQMGAELVSFSPIHDKELPEELDGMLLYGGYPELNARVLSENVPMRTAVAQALRNGMPCMAECGGFMYLHEEMEDMEGNPYPMAGVISGKSYHTSKLGRFGYITLEAAGEDTFGKIPAHEFHYFDSTNCGEAFQAKKPLSTRSWTCMHCTENLLVGFPHLYYYGNPRVPMTFLEKCAAYQRQRKNEKE